MPTSVLLADDSALIRRLIADHLRHDPEIELIAECSSFTQTIELAEKLRPRVIVMDLHMGDEHLLTPDMLKCSLSRSKILAMSIWKDDETRELAKAIGAAKLLDKSRIVAEVIPTIKEGNGGDATS